MFHVLNRGVGLQRLFSRPSDYEAFEDVVEETLEKIPMRICSYCLMPNHWHFVYGQNMMGIWLRSCRD